MYLYLGVQRACGNGINITGRDEPGKKAGQMPVHGPVLAAQTAERDVNRRT